MECNGLHHGEFDLVIPALVDETNDPTGWEITFIQWHAVTTMLLVGLRAVGNPTVSFVQLYYRGNYHWYLKQQFSGDGLQTLGFDRVDANRIYCTQRHVGDNGVVSVLCRVIDFNWNVTSNALIDTPSNHLVAVVDGKHANITPIGVAIIPPPMYRYQIDASAPIHGIYDVHSRC